MNQARFDSLGSDYDIVAGATPAYGFVQQTVADMVGAYAKEAGMRSMRLLDVGSGTGATALHISRTSSLLLITCVDHSPRMLGVAGVKLQEQVGRKEVTLIERDALAFLRSTPSKSYDVVASAYTFHNWLPSYRANVVREVFRVLTPSGIFVNGDKYGRSSEAEDVQDLIDAISSFFSKIGSTGRNDLLQEAVLHYLADFRPERRQDESSFVVSLSDAGFVAVSKSIRFGQERVIAARKER